VLLQTRSEPIAQATSHVQPNVTTCATPSDVLFYGWDPYPPGELPAISKLSDHPVHLVMSQVQNVLFKVHQSVLSDKSIAFKQMFGATEDCGVITLDGHTDDKPLPPPVTEAGFELFLSVCYNK